MAVNCQRKREESKILVEQFLKPTPIIDCDAKVIQESAQKVAAGKKRTVDKAINLFYFVRDEIKYYPYQPRYLLEHFRASTTLVRGDGFCTQKAVLLVALSRAVGIPARLGFAIIRNHLMPAKMTEFVQGNVLPDHGYAELWLDRKWVKATVAFDLEMCQSNGIIPVEFDGTNDAKLYSHTQDGELHIEYLRDRGPYDDVPLDEIREWAVAVAKPAAINEFFGGWPSGRNRQ